MATRDRNDQAQVAHFCEHDTSGAAAGTPHTQPPLALAPVAHEGETCQSTLEVHRLRLKKFWVTSPLSGLQRNLMNTLAVISCIQFCVQTYLPNQTRYNLIFDLIEAVMACFFLGDWCLYLYLADDRFEQFFSFFSMVDLMTIVPITFTYGSTPEQIEDDEDYHAIDLFQSGGALRLGWYAIRALACLRLLRILRLHKEIDTIEYAVERKMMSLGLNIVTLLIFLAGLLKYVERHVQDYMYNDWIYFLLVTISTVGYGDIGPQSPIGRVVVMVTIVVALVFVPKETSELADLMRETSVYQRHSYRQKSAQGGHVVVAGDLSSVSLFDFFTELFHEDHDVGDLRAVILQPCLPSAEMASLLRSPVFSIVITYLEGSPLSPRDLERARITSASAVFLLTNKFATDPDEEDAKVILQQFAMKRYVTTAVNGMPTPPKSLPAFMTQVIRPDNMRHLFVNQHDIFDDDVICLNQLKMGILAKACVFPGTAGLLANLFASSSLVDVGPLEPPCKDWNEEFVDGTQWEVYRTRLSKEMKGFKFIDLARLVAEKRGALLFAVGVKRAGDPGQPRILLNPTELHLPDTDGIEIDGYVIAKDQQSSNLSLDGEGAEGGAASGGGGMATGRLKAAGEVLPETTAVVELSAVSDGAAAAADEDGYTMAVHKRGMIKHVSQADLAGAAMTSSGRGSPTGAMASAQPMSYKLRKAPVSLEEATIDTSLFEEAPGVSGHLIIIAESLRNLPDVIRPLRLKRIGTFIPIVILHPRVISPEVWKKIANYDGVYVVRGSPLDEDEFLRAGIATAKRVMMLAAETARDDGMEALNDATNIFAYHLVHSLNPSVHIVIEMGHNSNVTFIEPSMAASNSSDTGNKQVLKAGGYRYSSRFAQGNVFASSMLDTITCQTYHSAHVIPIIYQLIFAMPQDSVMDESTGGGDNGPRRQAGDSADDRYMRTLADTRTSSLYQIAVPAEFVGQRYTELFHAQLEKGNVPLALVRAPGTAGSTLEYVYINPSPRVVVGAGDRVFILSREVPVVDN